MKLIARRLKRDMVTLVIATILLTATVARAEPSPVPMPESGGSCPHGYFRSAGFCVPRAGAQEAIPQHHGRCPHGWTVSGSFCLRSGQREHECYHGYSKCF